MDKKVAFRVHYQRECFQGEPSLFAKYMWHHNYSKTAVISSVNAGYSDEDTGKIKTLKGYASAHVIREGADMWIDWKPSPPARVTCMPDHSHQFFVDWDEGLKP